MQFAPLQTLEKNHDCGKRAAQSERNSVEPVRLNRTQALFFAKKSWRLVRSAARYVTLIIYGVNVPLM